MSILTQTIKNIFGNGRRNAVVSNQTPVDHMRPSEAGSIICFTSPSDGDALAHLTRELIQPIANRASRVQLLELPSTNWWDELNAAVHDPVWFAFAFSGDGQEISVERPGGVKNLWEDSKIPFVRMFGDTPAYFPKKHAARYRNSINIYGSQSHADFYRRWIDDCALTATLPAVPMDARPLDQIDEKAKLDSPIIFPKNGNSVSALQAYWRMALPTTVSNALQSVAEECVSQSNIDDDPHIDDRILNYYKNIGIDISLERPLLCFLVAQVDDYLRRFKSTMIAEAILDLPVSIHGNNWRHVDFYGKRASLKEGSNYAQTRKLLPNAPAIIDMSPNISNTPHDRVCRAAGCGTAFLTNQQKYIQRITGSPAECTFSFNKNSIHDLVEYYVLNPGEAVKLGLRQAAAFRAAYPEQRYAEILLSVVHIMHLRLQGRPPPGTQNFVEFPSG